MTPSPMRFGTLRSVVAALLAEARLRKEVTRSDLEFAAALSLAPAFR